MHISEGVLPSEILISGWAISAPVVAYLAYRLKVEKIPQVACMSAIFFIASFIHLPVGASSVHLILGGLIGAVLGRDAILAIFVGLMLQGVFFGFGGITILGVNTAIIGFPAVLGAVFVRVWKNAKMPTASAFFLAGAVPILISTLLLDLILFASGKEFYTIITLISLESAVLAVLEGIIALFALKFIVRVKKEILL
ncbi:MAG: cobalt transporter CbiM [Campylobacter sp.]|nr:cobalt transporter CbiM [Campylobacter sp.]